MWRIEVDPIYVAYIAGVSTEASYACDATELAPPLTDPLSLDLHCHLSIESGDLWAYCFLSPWPMSLDMSQGRSLPAATGVPLRRRARIACGYCNARRVRCDAFLGSPCSNCTTAGTNCQLIDSKRGKYDAPSISKLMPIRIDNVSDRYKRSASNKYLHRGTPTSGDEKLGMVQPSSRSHRLVQGSGSLSSGPCLPASQGANGRSDTHADYSCTPASPRLENPDQSTGDGSEILYARLSEVDPTPKCDRIQNGSKTFYLGKPSNLAYVVHEAANFCEKGIRNGPVKKHVRMPSTVDQHNAQPSPGQKLEPEVVEFLTKKGALKLPEKSVSDSLIQTYFDFVQPAFPIFDRIEFATLYNSGTLSLLVHYAVYLMASTICDENLLRNAGFQNRTTARKTFYTRVKALYEADYEMDKVTLVRVLLLMSFCWTGATDEKDTWHWLGAAIGLAQTQGMHISAVHSDISTRDQSLWRKIWWSLYIRDRHLAAALGRPMRIRDDDCDVEILNESDFEDIAPVDSLLFGTRTKTHILYAIHSAKLAMTFGKIISIESTAKNSKTISEDRLKVARELRIWEEELPIELSFAQVENAEDRGFWINMLHITYNNHLILLNRPSFDKMATSHREFDSEVAFTSANRITRIVDDLLTTETLRYGQFILVPCIFGALTMHTIMISNGSLMQRRLTNNRAQLCVLGLSQVRNSWPCSDWVYRLFVSLLEKLNARPSQIQEASSGGQREPQILDAPSTTGLLYSTTNSLPASQSIHNSGDCKSTVGCSDTSPQPPTQFNQESNHLHDGNCAPSHPTPNSADDFGPMLEDQPPFSFEGIDWDLALDGYALPF
ncbi:hypothetical protein V490_05907 [Pseudogymnoascus sp. VKM F-3557]|nr:hypothetical protein V490_05907 [Pseudogymnoascus sp. VKM F-3557]